EFATAQNVHRRDDWFDCYRQQTGPFGPPGPGVRPPGPGAHDLPSGHVVRDDPRRGPRDAVLDDARREHRLARLERAAHPERDVRRRARVRWEPSTGAVAA